MLSAPMTETDPGNDKPADPPYSGGEDENPRKPQQQPPPKPANGIGRD
jgi:hypothetical protein